MTTYEKAKAFIQANAAWIGGFVVILGLIVAGLGLHLALLDSVRIISVLSRAPQHEWGCSAAGLPEKCPVCGPTTARGNGGSAF